MADNVYPEATVTPAANPFAADLIDDVLYPRTKLIHGADGVNAGDVSAANPLPVGPIAGQVGVAGGAGAVSALTQRATLASDDPAVASLAVLDDWDESDRAKTNPIVGQAGVAAGAGAVDALTQRVTHASDDPAVAGIGATGDSAAIAGGTGSLSAKMRLITSQLSALAGYLDGVESGLSGLATETTLGTAKDSLAVIDDWDESDRAKVNLIVGQAGVAAGAGAVDATTQRVTHASDDPAVSGIGATGDAAATAGGTGSLSAKLRLMTSQLNSLAGYLDGVEPALASLALESGGNLAAAAASLSVLDDWDETDRAKVNLIVGQAGITAGAGSVAANTPRVTHASDDPAITSLALIDDPVIADDSAFTPATSKVMMAGFEADESSTDSVDEGDAGAARITLDRKLIVQPQPHTAGGVSVNRNLDVDETEDDVKTSAGQIYGLYFFNASTSIRYLKFYNATAANTTVGSTTPFLTIPLPASSSGGVGGVVFGAHGIAFDTALCIAATTGLADNDSGAPGANEVIVMTLYK